MRGECGSMSVVQWIIIRTNDTGDAGEEMEKEPFESRGA